MAAFNSPIWDFILGLSDERTFIFDVSSGYCCMDSGATAKIRDVLYTVEPEDREGVLEALLVAMRHARDVYNTKGVPLNTEDVLVWGIFGFSA